MEVISRATYKKVKRYDRFKINIWLHKFGTELYNDGCLDSTCAMITALHDILDLSTEQIGEIIAKKDGIIQAINEKEISVKDILAGLREEGLTIHTDFEPEIPEAKEVTESDIKQFCAGETKRAGHDPVAADERRGSVVQHGDEDHPRQAD